VLEIERSTATIRLIDGWFYGPLSSVCGGLRPDVFGPSLISIRPVRILDTLELRSERAIDGKLLQPPKKSNFEPHEMPQACDPSSTLEVH